MEAIGQSWAVRRATPSDGLLRDSFDYRVVHVERRCVIPQDTTLGLAGVLPRHTLNIVAMPVAGAGDDAYNDRPDEGATGVGMDRSRHLNEAVGDGLAGMVVSVLAAHIGVSMALAVAYVWALPMVVWNRLMHATVGNASSSELVSVRAALSNRVTEDALPAPEVELDKKE